MHTGMLLKELLLKECFVIHSIKRLHETYQLYISPTPNAKFCKREEDFWLLGVIQGSLSLYSAVQQMLYTVGIRKERKRRKKDKENSLNRLN